MGLLQRVVHNEAMKNDPPEIYGWRVFMLAASACFGGMIFGWDIGTIGGVLTLPAFDTDYNLGESGSVKEANLSANIVSTLQAGCFFGSLASYWFCDKFGRKPALITASIWVILGVVIQTASSGSVACLYVGRFVSGVGVGAASMLTPLYIAENAPRAIRGGLTGCYQLFIATGTMLAFWVNYGAELNLSGKSTYLVPLAMQMLPAIFLLVGMSLCNESPRWLARQDNWEKATRVMVKVTTLPEEHPYIQMELAEMREQLAHERTLVGGASFMDLQREMWLIPGNRKRALISMGIMICQQMTGTNAINYYAPQIFEDLGIDSVNSGLFATGVYGIVKMVTCAAFLLLAADSLGRRKSLLWTSIAQAAAMFIIGAYVYTDPPVKGAAIPPYGYVSLVCIYLFAGFYQFGWGPCPWIFVSEIPTARLRSLNVAIAAATQWLFNFVVARAVPNMLATVGNAGYGTYFIFGSFCFVMFFYVWFLIPETKGLSLEKMDDLFGVTEMAKKLEDDEFQVGDERRGGGTEGDVKEAATATHLEAQRSGVTQERSV